MRRRLEPTTATLKVLFAASRNQCAHPACTEPLVVDEVVVGEVCHIHAVHAVDARFDPRMSDEELRALDNLILLCHRHHRLIDQRAHRYPASEIRTWKAQHEEKSGGSEPVSEQALVTLLEDASNSTYEPRIWECAERLHHLMFRTDLFHWPQQPMNDALELLAGIADTEVELLHERLRHRLAPEQRLTTTLGQRLWRAERDSAAAREAEEHRGGTMARAVFASAVFHSCTDRLAKLRATHSDLRRHVPFDQVLLDALVGTPNWRLPPLIDEE